MKQLEINGNEYEIKFSYGFYNRLMEDADARANARKKDSGSKDNTVVQVNGFSSLILSLIDRDPEAIVDAYHAAIVGKKRPTRKDVEKALADAGIWDSKDPFGDLYKELRQDGFLRLKIQHLKNLMQEDVETAKVALEAVSESAGKSKEDQKDIKEAQNQVIVAQKSYEMMDGFLNKLEQ